MRDHRAQRGRPLTLRGWYDGIVHLVHECGHDADAPADASLASLASVALVDHSTAVFQQVAT